MAITDTVTHALLIDGEALPTDDTRYEPAASAWTREVFRAQRAAREREADTVWIDEHLAVGSKMPHGGVKGSGFGKDMSMRKGAYDAVSPR